MRGRYTQSFEIFSLEMFVAFETETGFFGWMVCLQTQCFWQRRSQVLPPWRRVGENPGNEVVFLVGEGRGVGGSHCSNGLRSFATLGREGNWFELTFAKTSGIVSRDRRKIDQQLTGAFPEPTAACFSAPVSFSVSEVASWLFNIYFLALFRENGGKPKRFEPNLEPKQWSFVRRAWMGAATDIVPEMIDAFFMTLVLWTNYYLTAFAMKANKEFLPTYKPDQFQWHAIISLLSNSLSSPLADWSAASHKYEKLKCFTVIN